MYTEIHTQAQYTPAHIYDSGNTYTQHTHACVHAHTHKDKHTHTHTQQLNIIPQVPRMSAKAAH